MGYLANPSCEHPEGETCEVCDQVHRIMEGMSAGTASLVIRDAVDDKIDSGYTVEGLKNRGRYYTASIVDTEGNVIQKLIVDKQTGDVHFA
jgi:hypothetical protein